MDTRATVLGSGLVLQLAATPDGALAAQAKFSLRGGALQGQQGVTSLLNWIIGAQRLTKDGGSIAF